MQFFAARTRQGPKQVRPLVTSRQRPGRADAGLLCLLFRDFRTLLACFGKSYCDGLLLALHGAALTAFAGLQGAALFAVYRTFDALACCASVLCHGFFLA